MLSVVPLAEMDVDTSLSGRPVVRLLLGAHLIIKYTKFKYAILDLELEIHFNSDFDYFV